MVVLVVVGMVVLVLVLVLVVVVVIIAMTTFIAVIIIITISIRTIITTLKSAQHKVLNTKSPHLIRNTINVSREGCHSWA